MSAESTCPVSVLIATRNEERNLDRCLESLRGWADEILVVDSQSTDRTLEIAASQGADVVQFHYQGGWPKKRQWALETYPFRNDWILILDADEILDEAGRQEIARTIRNPAHDGYWLCFEIFFLGRQLRWGDTRLWKLSLFRHGKGAFEKRYGDQDLSMSDVEANDHVVVEGSTGRLSSPIRHENSNSLDRYITKHNEYSNLEARVQLSGESTQLEPSLFGNQAARRRWLKTRFLSLPGSPVAIFLFFYIARLGFLDGVPGLIYATFRGVQFFHVKAKMYEIAILPSRDWNR